MGSRPGQQRYCRCGTHLAADNTGGQCARCQRAARDKLIAPPEVPAEFWDTEQFRAAFAAQHIGWIGRAYRMSPYHHVVYGPGGISQELLGQWLGLKQPQVSRIETGRPILNLDTLRYWAQVLRIPPERLWFDFLGQDVPDLRHPDDANSCVPPDSVLLTEHAGSARLTSSLPVFLEGNLGLLLQLAGEDGEDIVKRRALLRAATLLGLSVTGTASTLGLETVRRELNHSMADRGITADVDDWREIAVDYGHAYLTTDPATLLHALTADLYGLELTLQRRPDETAQRQLLQVGALLAAFMAQTMGNLGNLFEARRWWRTARHAADEAGDPCTLFWVRGLEVVRAGYENRPVRFILQLVKEAEPRLDEATPEVLPEFLSGKAQTLALAGRHVEAEQALRQLRECFDKLPPAPPDHRYSLFDFGEENLRYTESFVYSHMGDFAKAEQAQQAALGLYPDSNIRGPAKIELQRALCLVRGGDPKEGARHAQTIITNLPVMHHVRPVVDLSEKVLSVIPVHERHHSWAQEYRECLKSSFPQPGQSAISTGT